MAEMKIEKMAVKVNVQEKKIVWSTVELPEVESYKWSDLGEATLNEYVEALTNCVAELKENDAPYDVLNPQKDALRFALSGLESIQREKKEQENRQIWLARKVEVFEEFVSRFSEEVKTKLSVDPERGTLEYNGNTVAEIKEAIKYGYGTPDFPETAKMKLIVEGWRFGSSKVYNQRRGGYARKSWADRRYKQMKSTGYFSDKAVKTIEEFIARQARNEQAEQTEKNAEENAKQKMTELGMPLDKYGTSFNKYSRDEGHDEGRRPGVKISAHNGGKSFKMNFANLTEEELLKLQAFVQTEIHDYWTE